MRTAEFLPVGEACETPAPGLKDRTFDSSGFSDTDTQQGLEQALRPFHAPSFVMTEFDLICLSMLQFSYEIMNHIQTW